MRRMDVPICIRQPNKLFIDVNDQSSRAQSKMDLDRPEGLEETTSMCNSRKGKSFDLVGRQ